MTYNSVVEMGNSQSLLHRVAACAAEQGNTRSRSWASENIMKLASDPRFSWQAAWDYATNEYNVNQNPDTGRRVDVIGDDMILTGVQTLRGEQSTESGWPVA